MIKGLLLIIKANTFSTELICQDETFGFIFQKVFEIKLEQQQTKAFFFFFPPDKMTQFNVFMVPVGVLSLMTRC